MRQWLSHAASLVSQQYTAEGNLSCTASKACRFVLLDSKFEYGVGIFLLRIDRDQLEAELQKYY